MFIIISERFERDSATDAAQVSKPIGIEQPKPAKSRPTPARASPTQQPAAHNAAPVQPKPPAAPERQPQAAAEPSPVQQPPNSRLFQPPSQQGKFDQGNPHQVAPHPREADERSHKAQKSAHPTPKRSARSKPTDPSNPNHPPPPQLPPRRHAAHSGPNWGEQRQYCPSTSQHHTTWLNKRQKSNINAG